MTTPPTSTRTTSKPAANAALFLESFQAFGRGDFAAVVKNWSPDILWHAAGRNPLSGDYRGPDAILGLFGRFAALTEGTFRPELVDMAGGEDHAVLIARTTARRGGRRLDAREIVTVRIADGRVVEAWHVAEDQAAWDAFWS